MNATIETVIDNTINGLDRELRQISLQVRQCHVCPMPNYKQN